MAGSRFRAAVGAGIAGTLFLTGVAPALAAPPTPQQIGLPDTNPNWQELPTQDADCQLADSCGLWAWLSPNRGFVIEQSGYVKGKLATKYRMNHASDTYQTAISNGETSRETFKVKYFKSNRQHKMKMKIYSSYTPGSGVQAEAFAYLVVAQDQVRKRAGTSAPFAKKTGIGTLLILRRADSLPSKVTGKKNVKLRKSMYKIIKAGADQKLSGPVKL